MLESRERNLHMRRRRHYDANKINVLVRHKLLPVSSDMFDAEVFSDALGTFTSVTGDGHDPGTTAITKAGDLRAAGETGADDSNSNR